ncbi:hypothetical protein ABZP36_007181 [Zizania latifolia]
MRRRWSRTAVVACLVLLAAACAESSRPLPATEAAVAAAESGGGNGIRPRSAFDVVVAGLVGIGLGRRWRRGGADGELVDDDKRRLSVFPLIRL